MSFQAILLECRKDIATITLNQPNQRNALSKQLIEDTRAALAQIDQDSSVRALILTGRGAAFCAGGDLSIDMPEDSAARADLAAENLRERVNPLIRDIHNLRCPTIAAVQGVAAGAGASLALATDICIAARSSFFLFPFMPRLGIVPDAGGTWLIPAKVGRARSMGLCLLGDRLPAEKAEEWGLIWSCVDDEALTPTADKIAARLANTPRHAAKEMRDALASAHQNGFSAQLDWELEAQRRLLATPEFYEGVRAFMEKRDPEFD